MRRGEIFWGSLLILLGTLFFLRTAGYFTGDILGWFWPFFLIAIGIWIVLGGWMSRATFEKVEKFSVPLQNARRASLSIEHGAGQIDLRAGANAGDFMTGSAGTGMNKSSRLVGDKLEVEIEAGPSFIPLFGPEGGVWQYRLNPDIPISLTISAGASRLDLDLTDLQVANFSFEGGASTLNLNLPARVENAVMNLEAGAANIRIHVPPGLAARFKVSSVGSVQIDETLFPRQQGGFYQSAGYEAARNRVEVFIEGGATSIQIL